MSVVWWDNSSNETGFKVERKTGVSGTYTQVTTSGVNQNFYDDQSVAPGTYYCYRVRATNGAGDSDYSNEGCTTTPGALPAAPSGLSAEWLSATQAMRLQWTDNSNNETGFKIERIRGGIGGSWAQIGTALTNAFVFYDGSTSPATEYCYRVRATNGAGDSSYSNDACATRPGVVTLSVGQRVQTLQSGVHVRDGACLNPCSVLATLPTGSTGTIESGPFFNDGFAWWRINWDFAPDGYTAESDPSSGMLLGPIVTGPAAPSGLSAEWLSATQAMRLQWTDNSNNETGFKIERIRGGIGGSWAQIGTALTNAFVFYDGSTSLATEYCYRVRATNGAGDSSYSDDACATRPGVVTLSVGQRVQTLQSGVQVRDGACLSLCGVLATLPTGSTGTIESGPFFYDGFAWWRINWDFAPDGYTAESDPSSGMLLGPIVTGPAAPSGLSAEWLSATQAMRLQWADNSNNETGFKIERRLSAGGIYSPIGTALANAYVFFDTATSPSVEYCYHVRATTGTSDSTYSNEACASSLAGNFELSGFVESASYPYQRIAGATVTLGSVSTPSDDSGEYRFQSIPSASQRLRVSAPGYGVFESLLDLDLGSTNYRVVSLIRQVEPCSPLGSLTVVVEEATTGSRISGASVELNNGGAAGVPTSPGEYSFASIAGSQYTLTVRAAGFAAFNTTVSICDASQFSARLIRESTIFGFNMPTTPVGGDPVNLATGAYVYAHTDLRLPGKGVPFVFERTYNSRPPDTNGPLSFPADGPLGFYWTHSFDVRSKVDGGNVAVRLGDGRTITFTPDGQGGFVGPNGVFDRLTVLPGGGHELRTRSLVRYRFAPSGELLEIRDRNDNTMTLSYAGDRLAQVIDTAGRAITFSYGANGRLASITDPLPRTIQFGYDAAGNLTSVTDARSHTTQFSYDANHQLLTAVDRRGNPVVSNTYDAAKRVVTYQDDAMGSATTYEYDEVSGRTTLVRDASPGGLAIQEVYAFDNQLRLVHEEDGLGHAMAYRYDSAGNRVEVKDKRGFTTVYAYDERGNVTRKTDALGNVTQITYDDNDNPETRIDSRGKTTIFTYDARGNLILTHDPLGFEMAIEYDGAGLPTVLTDARGKKTIQSYDAAGNLVKIHDAASFDAFFQPDAVGRRIRRTDPNGHVTLWQYDENDNLISTTAPDGGVTTAAFDENDNLASVTDPLLRVASFVYDEKDRLVEAIDTRAKSTRYEYDALDRRTAVVDRTARRTEMVYDAAGRLVRRRDARGYEWTYAYDPAGNRIAAQDPLGHSTTADYDALDRLVSQKDALQHETKTVYDELGRVIETEDARQKKTHFGYDDLGRLSTVTDARNGTAVYAYDGNGNRTRQTEPEGDVTTFAYDDLNRLIRKDEPLGGFWLYGYDPVGNRISTRDANGAITTYSYDENDRLKTVLYPGGPSVAYTYDLAGHRKTMADGLGTATYAYDEADRLLSMTDAFGKTVGHGYDDEGRRTRLVYPSGSDVLYGYDLNGRLEHVTDWLGGVTEYVYDAAGRLGETRLPNGTRTLSGFDTADRLTSLAHQGPGSAAIASWSFALDEIGNPTHETRSQPLEASPPAATELYQYEKENRIHSRDAALAGLDAYAHDGNGNRIQDESPTGTRTQVFDARDLLVARAGPAGIVQHGYDGDGRRLRRTENGAETRFVLDTLPSLFRVLQETDGNGVVQASYVYGLGLISSVTPNGISAYYHYDHQGNTIALTNAAGAVTDTRSYDAFGEDLGHVGTTWNPFTFLGAHGVMEEGGKAHYVRARFYDLAVGRFVAKDRRMGDVANSQSLNRYAYALNSPLRLMDVDGQIPSLSELWGGYDRLLHKYVLDPYLHAIESAGEKVYEGVTKIPEPIAKGIEIGVKQVAPAAGCAIGFIGYGPLGCIAVKAAISSAQEVLLDVTSDYASAEEIRVEPRLVVRTIVTTLCKESIRPSGDPLTATAGELASGFAVSQVCKAFAERIIGDTPRKPSK